MNILKFGLLVGTVVGGAYAAYRRFKDDGAQDTVPTAMGTFPPDEEIKTFKPQPRKKNAKAGPQAHP